ncbi:Anaerobic sulfatase-maturating enzyme [Fundidesulfovibrio magnetotacticus]|uniref:Anaerobic sulfatase-maturating enzyme n=1 Tax=Fundidesulfovibrio magnetotacticus TaxID=2730080 RepID=A0A6V8LV87_9BACT|nr:peptide-modifying radical SAM enzyme CbpB [Fundidesulfovibrio magnetotacticus]GFK94511.1 Anaerobic sulfatase-maturating enzyme [Fundidesulfovibrio magnetotacticus]
MPSTSNQAAPERGRHFNTGSGPALQPVDIGHRDYMAVVDPDTAFWALVRTEKLGQTLASRKFMKAYASQADRFAEEMRRLRFGLTPSAVYFNPTERCNLNCAYCYIPAAMRSGGEHMSRERLLEALDRLKAHFDATLPEGTRPQVVFHGAEPLLNREAMFAGIERHRDHFRFGIQTNATLLDEEAIAFLTGHGVGVGVSLDGASAAVADRARVTWGGEGVSRKVLWAMEKLAGYPAFSVICTVTEGNVRTLPKVVEFFHKHGVGTCLLNMVRCTLLGARKIKPDEDLAARWFVKALERSHELYKETGRKLVVGNFANILLAILAPTARRLMCDISPCGGGRCFFALAPGGDVFPCSEFIGLPDWRGGNLFADSLGDILESAPFKAVTGRKVEDIEECSRCAVRHFCGSPCPAEAAEMNGGMDRKGAFCRFYEEQARYAFRLIADGRADDFLWDGWDEGVETTFEFTA